MKSSGGMVLIIVFVCATSARLGRLRRASGRPISPRTTVTVMATAWAMAWLGIGLPALVKDLTWLEWPWPHELSALLGLATAPLMLVLAASYLPGLNATAKNSYKKLVQRHPLDP